MNDADTRAVLVVARAKIAEGWTQGAARNGRSVCAGQAIAEAVDTNLESLGDGRMRFETISNFMLSIINETQQGCQYAYGSIPQWNDYGGRTKADVLAMFDKAIRRLDVKAAEPVPVPEVVAVYKPMAVVIPIEIEAPKEDGLITVMIKKALAGAGV